MKRFSFLVVLMALTVGVVFGGTEARNRDMRFLYIDSASQETIHPFYPQYLELEFLDVPQGAVGEIGHATPGGFAFATVGASSCQVSCGTWAIHTAAADNDLGQFAGQVAWRADMAAALEARVRFDNPTCAWNVGFSDAQAESSTLPIVGSGALTITAAASNCAVFFFDADTTTDHIRTVCVKDGTKSTAYEATDTAITTAALAQTWHTLRVELGVDGTVTFYFDGNLVNAPVASAINTGVFYCPYFGIQNRAAGTRQFHIDYIRVWSNRQGW